MGKLDKLMASVLLPTMILTTPNEEHYSKRKHEVSYSEPKKFKEPVYRDSEAKKAHKKKIKAKRNARRRKARR